MHPTPRTARLLAWFFLGWLALSFPLFSIWDRDLLVLGWPLLPTAAYGIWLLLIVVLACWMEGADADADVDTGGADSATPDGWQDGP